MSVVLTMLFSYTVQFVAMVVMEKTATIHVPVTVEMLLYVTV